MKSLLVRRIIYLSFITAFLIITPLVILYTQGYRYNFKKGSIQKTGILVISSNPRQAEIILNGQVYEKDTTPARIENLLPGDYEIQLLKAGYHPWNKKLPIFENTTTFAEKILLWKQTDPTFLDKQQSITNPILSPDKKNMAFNSSSTIKTLNLENSQLSTIINFSNQSQVSNISWSNTSKKLLIKTQDNQTANTDYHIINLSFGNSQKQIPTQQKFVSAKWDQTNDNLIYLHNNQGIWQFDLFSESINQISSATNTVDFLVEKENIFFIKDQTVFQQTKNNEAKKLLAKINCLNCTLIDKQSNNLFVNNYDQNQIILIDTDSGITKNLPAKGLDWINGNIFLYYNDWEIWIYDTQNKKSQLITRLGKKITRAFWHPEGRHILFASDDQIRLIELDNRELRNVITLIETQNITQTHISTNGQTMYFIGDHNKQSGWFELNIR